MRVNLLHCAVGAAIFAASIVGTASAADPMFFTSEVAFNLHMGQTTKFMKGVEDFEYAQMNNGKIPFPDMLTGGVPRPPVFPSGLLSNNLIIQTNRNPGPLAPVDAPSASPQALFVVAPGSFGSNSYKVGEDLGILSGIHCSMDLIFNSNDKTGVGFELSRFNGFGNQGWVIGVFDTAGGLLGAFPINGPVPTNPAKIFFGVYSSTPIGRINIFDPDPTSPDAVDNIQMWVPAPGAALPLLAMGAFGLSRRRRSESR